MKPKRKRFPSLSLFRGPDEQLFIQAPLPDFFHTLPILLSIAGQGSGRQGPSPLAPPEPSPNE